MKKVLVTGAAGTIGISVIKYLLSEGKYEITVLDLKNKKVYKKLNKYKKRINVIYGDVLNRTLMEALVKDHDYVIHLATCLPPLSEFKISLPKIIEEDSIEILVRAINYYNPKCHLIYGSTTSLYNKENCTVKDKIKVNEYDYFNTAKYNAENIIKKNIKNYTILRIPLVLGDLRTDSMIYNIPKNDIVEVITKEDAAFAFVKTIDKVDKLNKKILNIGGGDNMFIPFNDLLMKIFKYHGVSWNFILNKLFISKNYHSFVLGDSNLSDDILEYRNDTLDLYFKRQKYRSRKRRFSKFLGLIFVKCLTRKDGNKKNAN